jgi:Flp pilus assembly protein TadG
MLYMLEELRPLCNDRRGSVALIAAFLLPVALLIVGSVIDFGQASNQKQRLQNIVDKAALTAARELGLSDAKEESVAAMVQASVVAKVTANGNGDAVPEIVTTINGTPLEVSVRARQKTTPFFGGGFGFAPIQLEVTAVARIVGQPNICLLALESMEPGALFLIDSARMTGNNCSVFSNSRSSSGLMVRDNAVLTAQTVCSSGGVLKSGTIAPDALMDCPSFDDPLASRGEPVLGACEYTNTKIKDSKTTLRPGVYCGGLSISGTSDVSFEPGVYSIKDGIFELKDRAMLTGTNVSVQLGPATWFYFGADTAVSLSASKNGPLAGLLFFASRQQSKLITHTILSKNAQLLVGTVYLPNNSLIIDGDSDVGGASAYTAIVARRVVLLNGPNLVLNANYDQTDVPVPAGIRGADQPVMLVK